MHFKWNGFGLTETIWTVVMLVIATVLGLLMTLRRSEVFFTLVLIWAFIGITQNGSGDQLVTITAWAGAAILLVVMFLARSFLRKKQLIDRYKRP